MSEKETKLVTIEAAEQGLELRDFDQMQRFARMAALLSTKSATGPKDTDVADVLMRVQAGAELGLTPVRALHAVYVVDGKVAIMSNPAKAIIDNRLVLAEPMDIQFDGEGDERRCVVRSRRKGWTDWKSNEFSMADAKVAGLSVKDNWKKYPDRMLRARALGQHCADWYGDILLGLPLVEEVTDYGREAPRRIEEEGPGDDPLMEVENV